MNISVQLFAAAKDVTGSSPVVVRLPQDGTVRDLRLALIESYAELRTLGPVLLVAVNNSYAGDDYVLQDSDEVACFPPVSGG